MQHDAKEYTKQETARYTWQNACLKVREAEIVSRRECVPCLWG